MLNIGSYQIPPSKFDESRELYTRSSIWQQRLLNIKHDKERQGKLLATLQDDMNEMKRKAILIKDWKVADPPEGNIFCDSQRVQSDQLPKEKRKQKGALNNRPLEGVNNVVGTFRRKCHTVLNSVDNYSRERNLRSFYIK